VKAIKIIKKRDKNKDNKNKRWVKIIMDDINSLQKGRSSYQLILKS